MGLGRVGNLPEPSDLLSLAKSHQKTAGCQNTFVWQVTYKKTASSRIAVVGGSGGSLIPDAAKMAADVLITGDIGHHAALEAKFLGNCPH